MEHKKFLKQLASLGGKARAAKLSPARRKEIAKNAVAAREAKKKQRLADELHEKRVEEAEQATRSEFEVENDISN